VTLDPLRVARDAFSKSLLLRVSVGAFLISGLQL